MNKKFLISGLITTVTNLLSLEDLVNKMKPEYLQLWNLAHIQ